MKTLFFDPGFEKKGNFTFKYVVMLVVKVASRGYLEIKLVTVIEYAVEDGIEKNDSNKSCRRHEGLSFGNLDFGLDFEVDFGIDKSVKTRSAANPVS